MSHLTHVRLSETTVNHRARLLSLKRLGYVSAIPFLALGLLAALFWLMLPRTSQAEGAATARYVTETGTGTACTQLTPCALQTAVDLSADGDSVLVAGGLYASSNVTPVLSIDASIFITGGYDAANWNAMPDPDAHPTVLDSQSFTRVVNIQNASSPSLWGFTIRNGAAGRGAGIYNDGGSPTIRNNRIHDNQATTGDGQGAGVYDEGFATIEDNEIYQNEANVQGAGVFVRNDGASTTVIRFNDIYSNTTSGGLGGGVFLYDNTAAFLEGNVIHRNAANFGGGFYGRSSTGTVQSNLFYRNEATGGEGGALLFFGGTAQVWNNTVVSNTAASDGGGIAVFGASINISNTIIAFNDGGTIDGVYNSGGAVGGGYNNVHDDDVSADVSFSNPVNGDPQFVNPAGENFHIQAGSPNIDAGDPATDPSVAVDIDRQARPDPDSGLVDVGADEYYPAVPAFTYEPQLTEDGVDRGTTEVFIHTLSNEGTVDDGYTFTCSNDLGWTVTCPAGTGTVPVGDSVQTTTEVDVPAGAAPMQVGTTFITATSTLSPALSERVVVRATVNPMPGVAFTPSYSDSLRPGEIVTFTHTLTNTGDYTDTFAVQLLADTYGWAELLPSSAFSITLGSSDTEEVQVRVTVGMTAPAGLANTTYIQASSTFSSGTSAVVSDTVTAKATVGTRYVSTGGDDLNNNCTVAAQPCATIAHAVGQASSGDAVHVARGTYFESGISINDTVLLSGGWNSGFDNQDDDPAGTVIDAEGNARVFFIQPGSGIQPRFDNVTLRNGASSNRGGAVYVSNFAQPRFVNVVIRDSVASSHGGAIYGGNSALVTVRQSTFIGNSAGSGGGAIYVNGSTANIRQSRFLTNTTAGSDGGAILMEDGFSFIYNNLFQNNTTTTTGNGGALAGRAGTIFFGNNTTVANSAAGDGGGVYNDGASVTVANTIFVSNNATSGGAVFHNSGTTTVDYNLLWQNSVPQVAGAGATNTVNADPLFADTLYHLPPGSPAVDAGNPGTNLAVDFEDDFRPSDEGFDIGWDELAGCRAKRDDVIYGSIQDAIDAAADDPLILVTGICRGVHPLDTGGQTISQTVHLTQTLTIQGGWNADFSQRTFERTIVDPEGRGRGFYVSGAVSPTIDFLTIHNGDATNLGGGPAGEDAGGGIYNLDSNATFNYVSVLSGTATLGGGFYNDSGAPLVTSVPPADEEITLPNDATTTYLANSAMQGGGVYNHNGAPAIDGVLFYSNTAAAAGAGIYNSGAISVVNAVLAWNGAGGDGGALANTTPAGTFLHLTVVSNTAGLNGGGVYDSGGAPVRSSIFQGNAAASGAALYVDGSNTAVDYNYYHTGQTVVGADGGTHSISSTTEPGLRDPAGGDFHLDDGAPAEDAGDPLSPVAVDYEADPRPSNQTFDMGADEVAGCFVRLNGEIYGSLQVALDLAAPGDVIEVAGTCSGVREYDTGSAGGSASCADTGGLVRAAVILTRNVNLSGGWRPDFSSQDATTVLDAEGLGHVLYVGPAVTATVEGFHMINGDATAFAGSGNGGGICMENAAPALLGNDVYSNTAGNGGGIYALDSTPRIDGGNRVHNNEATAGGGLHLVSGGAFTATVQNNFFYANTASGDGGAIYNDSGDHMVWHNDVFSNTADTGGGVYVAAGAPDIRSNVVMSNTAAATGGIYAEAGATPLLDYNDVLGNANGDFDGTNATRGPNGFAEDPAFADPAGYDFTIQFSSPVVDRGDPTLTLVQDYEGDLRPSHQGFDVGADEVGNCFARNLNEPDAIYGSVQWVVSRAAAGDTVQFDGVCRGVNVQLISGATPVTQTLFISNAITLDGDWDYEFPDPGTLDAGDRGRTLYVASGTTVTVTNAHLRYGNAAGAGQGNGGGGLHNTGELTLLAVDLYLNQGVQGGAIYNDGALFLRESNVYSNTATSGAGLYNGVTGTGQANVRGSFFHDNEATNGGAVYQNGGPLFLDGNKLTANVATDGGGVYLAGAALHSVDVRNNFVYDNVASNSGGGLYNADSNGRVWHNTFINNTAGDGGGIFSAAGPLDVRSNIVDRNTGTGIHVATGSPTIDYNDVVANSGGDYNGVTPGPNDISQLPDYEDFAEDDFHLVDESSGIDVADPGLNVPDDYDGNVRPTNAGPDMGADEYDACRIQVDERIFGVLQTAIDYAEDNDFSTVKIARGECKGVHTINGVTQVGYVTEDLTFIGSLRRDDFSDPDDYHELGTVSTQINAEGQGRAIYVASGATASFTHIGFVNGDAFGAGSGDDGGNLYGEGTVSFGECLICNGYAENGGGYYGASGSSTDLTGGSTGGDTFGCPIITSVEQGDEGPEVGGYDFFGPNVATVDGGAFYMAGGAQFDVRNHGFFNNTAGNNGGGFYNAGNDGRLINAIFFGNETGNDGGGVYNSGILEMYHNTYNLNQAISGSGGAIFNNGSFTLNSSIIYQSIASSGGGGIHSTGGSNQLTYNNFNTNTPSDANIGLGSPVFTHDPGIYTWSLTRQSKNIDIADPSLLNPPPPTPLIDFDASNHIRPDGNPDHNGLYGKGSDIGADEYWKDFGCKISPVDGATATPGDIISYTFTITNTGWPVPPSDVTIHGYTDTLTVTLDSQSFNWTELAVTSFGGALNVVQVDDVTYVVEDMEWRYDTPNTALSTAQATLTVTVPTTATSGVQDTSVVRCRSASLPSRTQTRNAVTSVGLVSSLLVTPDYVVDAFPGDVFTFTHTITNVGNQEDTFAVTASSGPQHTNAALVGLDTGELISSTEVTLDVMASITVQLHVRVFDTAPAGEVATPGVVVRSTTEPGVEGAAQNRLFIQRIAGTRYVDGSGGSDSTNCTDPDQPCATIQRAIDQASAYDTVLVSTGTYTDHVTRTLGANVEYDQNFFVDKSITIEGGYDAAEAIPFATQQPITNAVTLSGEENRRVIYVDPGITVTLSSLFVEDGNAYVNAFNEADPQYGGGIYNAGATLTISGTWLLNNGAQYGGGVYHLTGTLAVQNSVFAGNSNQPNENNVDGEGGGLHVEDGTVLLENNTFADNQANAGASFSPAGSSTGRGDAVYQDSGTATLLNNIFSADTTQDNSVVYISATVALTNDYNLYYNYPVTATNFVTGPNSLSGDPAFSDGVYHIGPTSAAKDAGTPAVTIAGGVDFELEPRQQGAAVDIGADERTQRPGLLFRPGTQTAIITPTEIVTYTHVLTNTGDFADSFTLVMENQTVPDGGGWGYALFPTSTGSLATNQSVTVTLVITGGVVPGDMNTTTITATADTSGLSGSVVDTTRITQTAGVAIAPSRDGVGMAGQVVTYSHTLTNTGDGVDEFFLSVAEATPPEWSVAIIPQATGFLTAGETMTFTVAITVPAGTGGGITHTAVIRADAYDPAADDTLTDTTTITVTYGLSLVPDHARTVPAGAPTVYTHTLTNLGNVTDTVDLDVTADRAWEETVEPVSVTLSPLASTVVTMAVTPPSDSGGQTQIATVTATSQAGGVQATAVNTTTVAAQAGVALEPDGNRTAVAGTTLTFTHTLTNLGNLTDTFDLTATSSAGWLDAFTPAAVQLAPEMTATVRVTISVPAGATPGMADTTTLTATSTVSPTVSDTATDTTTVVPAGTLAVTIGPDNAGSGQPGEVLTYTHTLTNSGTLSDIFTLTAVSGAGWVVDVAPPATGDLAPGLTASVLVTVEIPAGATPGTVDTTTITATSVTDTGVFATATDTTTVVQPGALAVTIGPDNDSSGQPDETLSYTHTVTNSGTLADSYTLDVVSGETWTVTVAPDTLTDLAPGATAMVDVTVQIPPDTLSGTVDTTTVTVTSDTDPAVSDTATDTTTAGRVAGVAFTPDYTRTASGGETVLYTHVLTNSGNGPDTFFLSANSTQGWTVNVPPPVFLNAGETTTVDVSVMVLPGVSGVTDTATVTATSEADPATVATVRDTTIITGTPGTYDVAIGPNGAQSGQAGDTILYEHTVTNTGTLPDSYSIGVASSQNWGVAVSPPLVSLAPGESAPVQVTLVVPPGAANGAVDVTTVTVTSDTDPSVVGAATDTTTVGQPLLYLPIVFNGEGAPPPPTPTPTPTATPCTPTGIDLVVTDLWVVPATPAGGEEATVYVTLHNQGSTGVPFGNNFYLDFYLDTPPAPLTPGQIVWGVQGSWMGAGSSRTFSAPYTFSSGAHQLWAQADTDNSVAECPYENNNIYGPVGIGVSGPAGEDPAATSTPAPPPDEPRATPTPASAAGEPGLTPMPPAPTKGPAGEIDKATATATPSPP